MPISEHSPANDPQSVPFAVATRVWLRLGLLSFGGPAAQIAMLHDEVVTRRRWISDSRFAHAMNYCMLLPGPEAQQLVTYVGGLMHGLRGSLVAGLLFILPSVFVLSGLSVTYVLYGDVPWVAAMFAGLKPAVVATVFAALFRLGNKVLHSTALVVVAVIALVALRWLALPFPLIILGTLGVAALAALRRRDTSPAAATQAAATSANEHEYLINATTPHTDSRGVAHVLRTLAVAVALWLAVTFGVAALLGQAEFWRTLATFFTKAALVTFGGAYAVLPYVAQVSVEQLQWLNPAQMVDGLGLGESTPGPLVMVLSFVGFMGGYSTSGGAIGFALVALLATTFYTFLPSFTFIIGGAPLVERTRAHPQLRWVLSVVSAAVVGVLANLTIYLVQTVLIPAPGDSLARASLSIGWFLVSVVALQWAKVGMGRWFALSALVGLGVQLLVGL